MDARGKCGLDLMVAGLRGRDSHRNAPHVQEDDLLLQLVAQHGNKKWSQIATFLNGRLGKQCRER